MSRAHAESKVIAGLDEAGLGPLLGPLTVGYSAFRAPAGARTLWELLSEVVAPEPLQAGGRLVVADSKRVFARNPRGARRLEMTALSFLAAAPGGAPPDGPALLSCAPPRARPRADELARHPWYAHLPARLPAHVDAGRLELCAGRLRREMLRARVELLGAGVRVVPAGELNRSYRATGNKSLTVWEHVLGLLRHLWDAHGHEGVHVIVDRQGGRFHYARLLLRGFPSAGLSSVFESPAHSEYRLESKEPGGRTMRLTFAEGAERRAFSVALASCLAKYAREVCMDAFNRYFGALQPGLRPTAGYTTDGRRWMREAAPALERARVSREVLVRER